MKLILQIILILTIVITISICAVQPDLHKNVMVYDSAYTPVTEEDVKTETKDIPVMEITTKPVQTTIKAEKKTEPIQTETKVKTNNVQTQTKNASQKTTTAKKQTASTPAVNKTTTSKNIQPPVQTKTETKNTKVETAKEKVNIITTPPVKKEEVKQTKTLTQQEETIAWNKWRSALTNQIMQDTKLPAMPNGVVFSFSFDVDKYGKITNVKTGADPANYTPYAIQYIAPVIRSYQGRSMLNFPNGTARTSTTVSGKWRISSTEKYSTPQDYNDIEKIIKY